MTTEDIEAVSSKEALKDNIYEHCVRWCEKHLRGTPKSELNAAIEKGIGIMPFYEWEIALDKVWHLPRRNYTGDQEDKVAAELARFRWECFQEQCLDFYTGVKQ